MLDVMLSERDEVYTTLYHIMSAAWRSN